MKKDDKKKGKKNVVYPNGSLVKSFSISTENWEYLQKEKEHYTSYSITINKMLDKLRLLEQK